MKHPYTLDKSQTALVVVDMQEKFAPVIPDFDVVAQNITRLILTFQMYGMPILVTEQYPEGLGQTVNGIRKQFRKLDAVEKLEFACTSSQRFVQRLRGLKVKTVVLCGVETHVCINQTALGLLQRDYRVHVVADAVGSRYVQDREVALRKMERAGVIPSTTEMALFELTERAGTRGFKNVSRMAKTRPAPSKGLPVRAPGDTSPLSPAREAEKNAREAAGGSKAKAESATEKATGENNAAEDKEKSRDPLPDTVVLKGAETISQDETAEVDLDAVIEEFDDEGESGKNARPDSGETAAERKAGLSDTVLMEAREDEEVLDEHAATPAADATNDEGGIDLDEVADVFDREDGEGPETREMELTYFDGERVKKADEEEAGGDEDEDDILNIEEVLNMADNQGEDLDEKDS